MSSFRLAKNACHSAPTEFGSRLVAGVELLEIGGVGALRNDVLANTSFSSCLVM